MFLYFLAKGTQWQGMALQLAQNEIVFKTTLDECAEAFSKVVTWDLWEVLKKGLYEEIDIIQPALVAVQIALAKLWQNYGINPDIVVGHSMGEVSAAYIAGNITLDEAAEIICNRSLLMKTKSGQGEMLATDLTFEEATVITDKTFNEVSIAVVNSPNSIVLSGNPDKLKQILTQLEEEGRFAKRIMVDVASHSAQMDSILPSLAQKLDAISPKNSEVQFYSTALNKIVEGESLDAQYWTKNLRNPVQFGAVITSILKKESVAFFEMSPHPTLIHAIQENISLANENAKVFASLYREKNEQNSFFSNIGELYASGYLFDWKNIYKKWNKYIQLPNYAWQKQRFWFDEKPKNLLNKEDSNQNYIYTTSWQKINFELFYQDKSIGVYPLCNSKIPHDFENLEVVDLQNIGAKKLDTLVIYVNSLEKVTDSFIEYKSIFEKVLATKQQLEIIVVTHNAIVFEEEKTLNTVATILWGATRSLINEHPELDIKLIDTDSIISVSELIKAINLNKETVVRKEEFYSPVLIKQISFKKSLKHTEGVCLITGGTSGLGLETALWLANFGFKKIALVSRTGAKKETSQICDILMNRGVEIKIYSCDITSAPDLKNLINTISVELGDISTLIHAAGNLEDAPFINLDKNKIDNVLNPKLALPLIIENIGNTLKAVYLYSSAASILGTNAQSNYTAANFFLDQYAKILRNSSIEAISINWGNIGEIGMAAADDRRGKQLSELGIKVFDKQKFHSLLDTLWGLKVSQLMAIDIDFEKWSTSYPMLKHNSFFSNFIQQEIAHKPKNMDSHTNINSAIKFIKQTIVDHIATITKLPKANIKEDITFKSLGIDSMMAVQLKNKMQESFEMQIAVATIWSYPTVEKFSAFVVEELQLEDKFNLTTKAETSNNSTQNVDDMSLEDLMRELDEKSN
jgi:malonyl CoA-acyl carrier protein transacylase/short-subunit dehydrogenase/acyl carrier protein